MLKIDSPIGLTDATTGDLITIYRDSDPAKFNVFYPMPSQPRYRLGPDGKPLFTFLKYKNPIDRPDGTKGGGFCMFDLAFILDPATLVDVRKQLQKVVDDYATRNRINPVPAVEIVAPTFTRGKNSLVYPAALGATQVPSGGTPSLFGDNVSTFAIELSDKAATAFEASMRNTAAAPFSVRYDMWFWAQLMPISIHAYWNATKFYSFVQTIDVDWKMWGNSSYRETVREQMRQSESTQITFTWGPVSLNEDEKNKVENTLRDWATRALEDAVQRNMLAAIAPMTDDQRKRPDGIDDVARDITSTRIASVTIDYKESQTVEYFAAPQGMLPSVMSLKDAAGQPLDPNEFFRTVDLDDPFFQQVRVNATANADFTNLPIQSVEVKCIYKGKPMTNLATGEPRGEGRLTSPNDMLKFGSYLEDGDWKYKYSYQVNYRGESRQFQSPEIETNEGVLTIGVDDVGILAVDVSAGDLNWNDVDRATVTFRYEDTGVDPYEEQFILTQAAPTHAIQKVIFQPLRKNYRYSVKYSMKNGLEYQGGWFEGRSRKLFINDVFGGRRTIAVRGVADFTNRVQTVFVDLDYRDAANNYAQSKSQGLTAQSPFFEWNFPVIDPAAGEVTYRATIAYKDGTTDTVPVTKADGNTVVLPPAVEAFLEVQVVPDLVDWSETRLARVSLSYSDPDSKVAAARDLIFSPSNKAGTSWKVELKNKQQDSYRYIATYYMSDGKQRTIGPVTTRDRTLILDPSSRERARVPSVAVAA